MLSVRSASAPRALALRLALVLAGSAVMAVAAHVAVPMVPVPITLQTLAIPLVVLAIGRDLATLSMLAYLIEGGIGLPVFAPVNTGPGLLGPSAGYLWMYPVAAFAIGALCETRLGASYAGRWLAICAGTSLVFAGGVAWLVGAYHLTFANAVDVGVTPFLIGDALKITIAAGPHSRAREWLARLGV